VGGETIAVTFAPKEAGGFEGGYLANLKKVNTHVVTENYIDRMFALIENSDSFVIFRGGSGTISEFGTVWVLANIYHGHHKPFVLYGSFWWEIIDVLQRTMSIDEQEMSCFKIAETPEEVLKALQNFDWEMEQIDHSHCKICSERAFMT
jgi:predicted Rossmann-fold nucleotide-binding protein